MSDTINISLTISETQKGLLNGEYSCSKLVDSYLERIEKYDKYLNSLLTKTPDMAYKKAKYLDEILKNKGKKAIHEYPLLGCTVIHKDIFLTKGVRTTAGSMVLESYIPQYSATVVERLENAGCIMLGKANQDAWAHGSSGENSDFGPTKNPWNTKFVPGGSSSGSSAAVAANFSLFSTGTDTCGSIRLPANYCGLVGLKPTYGSVSRYGVIAMASSLDSVGHITRTVEDSEIIFNTTKGADNRDSNLQNIEIESSFRKLKIGIPKEFFSKGLDGVIAKDIDNAMKVFKKMGMEFVEVSLPHTKYGISVYYIIQPAEVSSNLGRYDGIRFGNERVSFGDEAKRRIMLGTYVLSAGYYDAYYLKAMKVRNVIVREVNDVFKDVDALIAPVAPSPPFKLGEKVNDPLKMYLTDIFAACANLSGIPSIAIPTGFGKSNLPLGFQIMAPRFSEKLLFSLGKRFQEEIGWKANIAMD